MFNQRQQSSSGHPIDFIMTLTDNIMAATGNTVVINISKDGGAFNLASGAVSFLGRGWYSWAGHTWDRDTRGELAISASGGGMAQSDFKYVITQYGPFSVFDASSKALGIGSGDDVYYSDVTFNVDNTNGRDEYTVNWFRNGSTLTTGVSDPTLQVIKRSDGSNLIQPTGLTEIGSLHLFKFDASGIARTSAGDAYISQVQATINGTTRTWRKIFSRDN